MIRLLTAVLLFASFHAVAEVTLTPLNNNTPADADDVMGNFNALNEALPPSDCTTDQIIKWDDSNDVWVCASDPFANLSCSAGDTLTYDGSEFTCACVPPGTAITQSNFYEALADWFAVGKESEYGDISEWCTEAVTDMSLAFKNQQTFNADIGGWDTSNVTNMSEMFYNARAFNRDIGRWDTSNVRDMGYMFSGAVVFNHHIGGWDTSDVTTMSYMFFDAQAFNQPIGGWNVSYVTDMYAMFERALTFDGPIDDWDVSSVVNMNYMFYSAEAFNQDLSDWDASSVQDCLLFAAFATAWLDRYAGSIQGKTPPLSPSLIVADCSEN